VILGESFCSAMMIKISQIFLQTGENGASCALARNNGAG
jgi:hypothetical protein